MSEFPGTPGPWFASAKGLVTSGEPERPYAPGSTMRTIGVGKVVCIDSDDASIWLGGDSQPPQSERKANRKAISALPDLYAVCAEIREHFGYFSEWDLPIGFEDRLNVALEKAGWVKP